MCCGEKNRKQDEPIAIIGWRAYYGDGTLHSSKDISWQDLPDDDLQHVNVYQSNMTEDGQYPRRYHLGGYDYYFRFDTEHGYMFAGSNNNPEEIIHRYPDAIIKRGKWIHLQASKDISNKASRDRFP
jgi:hypothetical protein